MPVSIDAEVRRLSQEEFGALAFEMMRQAFEIHRELGRFFDEAIYHVELIHRCPGARGKVAITVAFETFHKQYCVDLLVGGGATGSVLFRKDATGLPGGVSRWPLQRSKPPSLGRLPAAARPPTAGERPPEDMVGRSGAFLETNVSNHRASRWHGNIPHFGGTYT